VGKEIHLRFFSSVGGKFLKYKRLKLCVLADHTVAMVTNSVMRMITTC